MNPQTPTPPPCADIERCQPRGCFAVPQVGLCQSPPIVQYMTHNVSIIEAVGYLFAIVAILPAIRQIRHCFKMNSTAGLSSTTSAAWVFSWSAWVAYGFMTGSGPIVFRNVVGLLPAIALVAILIKHRNTNTKAWSVLFVLYAIGVILLWQSPVHGLALMTVLDIVFYLPSVYVVFRSKELSGVSLRANVENALLSGSWVVFLVLNGSASASFGWITATLSYACITILVLHRNRAYRSFRAAKLKEIRTAESTALSCSV